MHLKPPTSLCYPSHSTLPPSPGCPPWPPVSRMHLTSPIPPHLPGNSYSMMSAPGLHHPLKASGISSFPAKLDMDFPASILAPNFLI